MVDAAAAAAAVVVVLVVAESVTAVLEGMGMILLTVPCIVRIFALLKQTMPVVLLMKKATAVAVVVAAAVGILVGAKTTCCLG